jgi:hypothetical protein
VTENLERKADHTEPPFFAPWLSRFGDSPQNQQMGLTCSEMFLGAWEGFKSFLKHWGRPWKDFNAPVAERIPHSENTFAPAE